jgi:large subunit ribosomal protein L15
MALRKEKRVRKRRGSRMHGYGRIGQHRKGGQRGGKGKTGGKKHDWTYVTAKDPKRFVKHGFHRHDKLRQSHQTINVGELDTNIDRFTKEAPSPEAGPITVDLTAHGVDKVLGAGNITIPLTVTAPLFTHRAAEKIKAAGGKVKGNIQEPTKHPAPSLQPKPTGAPKPKPKPKPKPRTTAAKKAAAKKPAAKKAAAKKPAAKKAAAKKPAAKKAAAKKPAAKKPTAKKTPAKSKRATGSKAKS